MGLIFEFFSVRQASVDVRLHGHFGLSWVSFHVTKWKMCQPRLQVKALDEDAKIHSLAFFHFQLVVSLTARRVSS